MSQKILQHYVVGFLFDWSMTHVVLINKIKPLWQCGMLNGVGGKIEEGETPLEAMYREFEEEAGMRAPWIEFCELLGSDFYVHFFYASEHLPDIKTRTEEVVSVFEVETVIKRCLPTIPNIPWLLTMAISIMSGKEKARYFSINEHYKRMDSFMNNATGVLTG